MTAADPRAGAPARPRTRRIRRHKWPAVLGAPVRAPRAVVAWPWPDGSGGWEFGADGRHRRTVDGVTGTTIRRFTYDGAGRLTSIVDRDGNVIGIVSYTDMVLKGLMHLA